MGDRAGNGVRYRKGEVSFAPTSLPSADKAGTTEAKTPKPPNLGSHREESSPPASPRSLPRRAHLALPPSSSASPPASPVQATRNASAAAPSLTLSAAALRLQAPLEFTTPQQRREQLRTYLKTLGANEIATLAFRDLKDDMAAWGRQFQAALAPSMVGARDCLFTELAKEDLQGPDFVNSARGLERIVRTGRTVAAQLRPPGFRMPPLAMAMLAEALAELKILLQQRKRKTETIEKICADAVRNILVQNGFLSALASGLSGHAAIVTFKIVTYVKAVFGMSGTSQGATAAIVRAVENDDRKAAANFLDDICKKLADAKGIEEVHWPQTDMDGDSAAAKEHAAIKRELFIDTWNSRGRKSMQFPSRCLWHFLEADGKRNRWSTPANLTEWLGDEPSGELPEVILHVAGPNLLRYVGEYLLGGEHGKALGLRPGAAFKPELAVLLRREQDEFVLDFRAVDDDFNRNGLVAENGAEKGGEIVKGENGAAAPSCKVHLEVRLQIRFRQPDLFQMHSALIVKAEY